MIGVNDNHNHEYLTTNTSLAAFLVSEGFKLLLIQYVGKQGTYVFSSDNPTIQDHVNSFNRCEAVGNIVQFEMARNDLIDRIKRGLP